MIAWAASLMGITFLFANPSLAIDGVPNLTELQVHYTDSTDDASLGAYETGQPVNKFLFKSQWKEAMFRNPEEFQRFMLMTDKGHAGEVWETIYKSGVKASRYLNASKIKKFDNFKAIIWELAKDTDRTVGLQATKSRLQAASNRCPDCMDTLAEYAYQLSVKQTSGRALSIDEKAVVGVMDGMIDKGELLSIRSTTKQLLSRANTNYVNYLGQKVLLAKLTDLFNKYDRSDEKLQSLEDFLRTELSEVHKNELKQLAVKADWLIESVQKQAQEGLSNQERQKEINAREQRLVEADATIGLVGAIIGLKNPEESKRFTQISRSALSMYKGWADYLNPQMNVSKWAFRANMVTGFIGFSNLLAEESRQSEQDYIITALDQINQQLEIIQQRLGRIEDSLVMIRQNISRLNEDKSAQFSTLKQGLDAIRDDLTDDSLREWRKNRATILKRIELVLSTCRDRFGSREWSYKKQTSETTNFYRQQCLIPLLHVATTESDSPAVMDIPNAPIFSDSAVGHFEKALMAGMPLDLWIPQITTTIKTSDQRKQAPSKPTTSSKQQHDLCAGLFDVEIWRQAVGAYVELRVQAPDFIIDQNQDSELSRLDKRARSMGQKADGCMKQQLSAERFANVVTHYRETAEAVLSNISNLTIAFLNRKYSDSWCTPANIQPLQGLGTASDWVIRSCYISGPKYVMAPNNGLEIGQESLWFSGSTHIPWLSRPTIFPPDFLVLSQDVDAIAERLAAHIPPTPEGNDTSTREPLVVGEGNDGTGYLPTLTFGLRGVRSIRTVLGQIESPRSLGPPAAIGIPSVQRKDEVRSCLVGRVFTSGPGQLSPIDGVKKCGEEAIAGCFSLIESTPMSDFSYQRVCDGAVFVPLHAIGERVKIGENFLHDDMENFRNQSLTTHMTAAMSVRNHGLPRALKRDECGHPLGLCDRQYTYVLNIHGLDSNGVFAPNGTFKQTLTTQSIPANIEESFKLDKLKAIIDETRPKFNMLKLEWLEFIKSSPLLEPSYKALNHAYAQLKIHALLHLQLNAPETDGVKEFVNAPLSGRELAEEISLGRIPANISNRLILSNDNWRSPFPTIARMHTLSKVATSNVGCVKAFGSNKNITFKYKIKGSPDTSTFDLYCEMWKQVVKAESDRFKAGGLTRVQAAEAIALPFTVGSLNVLEGLELLAYQQEMEKITTILATKPIRSKNDPTASKKY